MIHSYLSLTYASEWKCFSYKLSPMIGPGRIFFLKVQVNHRRGTSFNWNNNMLIFVSFFIVYYDF